MMDTSLVLNPGGNLPNGYHTYVWHPSGIFAQGGLIANNNSFISEENTNSAGTVSFRGTTELNENSFTSLNIGALTYDRFNTIKANKFINNKTGIWLGGIYYDITQTIQLPTFMDMTCNFFDPAGAVSWPNNIGLNVEDDVNLSDIGGPGGQGNPLPNANVWPVQNRGLITWGSPSNWTSFKWGNNVLAKYYKFDNEFIGDHLGILYTLTSTGNCTEKPTTNPNLIQVCEGIFPVNITYFPYRTGIATGFIPSNQHADISIYPNPATKKIVILGANELFAYRIYDALGKLVLDGTVQGSEINIETLTNGIYRVHLLIGEELVKTTFIKE
jgi:hypothetical protein